MLCRNLDNFEVRCYACFSLAVSVAKLDTWYCGVCGDPPAEERLRRARNRPDYFGRAGSEK